MTEVHVIDMDELEAEAERECEIVDARGQPVRTQRAGQSCVAEGCGAPGAVVKAVIGGECVCMKCGYQE